MKKTTPIAALVQELRKGYTNQSTKLFVYIARDLLAEGLQKDDKALLVLAQGTLTYSLNLARFHKDKNLISWIKEEAKKLMQDCLAQQDKR